MKKNRRITRETEIDLKPFMNVIVVLIPVLLISAEFAKMAVIDIKPPKVGSNIDSTQKVPPELGPENKLELTAIVTDSVVTLGARGGFLPSIFYREFHKYVAKDDHEAFTIEYNSASKVYHPKTKREMTKCERYDISLFVTDEKRNIINRLYTKSTHLLVTDAKGNTVSTVKPGDTLFAITHPRLQILVHSPYDFVLQPLSAYDELQNRLMAIKERYCGADDADAIIIASENNVIYDKIVQIMDAARNAEFPNISIAKLRS
jgi:biopolymer transport protein ExbD